MVRLHDAAQMRDEVLALLFGAGSLLQLIDGDAPFLLRPAMLAAKLVDAAVKRSSQGGNTRG